MTPTCSTRPCPCLRLVTPAALLNLGDLYANRESVVAGQTFGINPTAQALLQAYRPYRV